MSKHRNAFGFFDIAAAILLAVFFLFGALFSCSFKKTGDSSLIYSDESYLAVFETDGVSNANVRSVYLNVGEVHAKKGEKVSVTVKRSSSKSNKPSLSFLPKDQTSSASFAAQTDEYLSFNWLEITPESSKTVALLSVESTRPFRLNEIVCLDETGNLVPLTVSVKYSEGYADAKSELRGAVDAPSSFTNKTSSKYVYTEKESRLMTAVQALRSGRAYADDVSYYQAKDVSFLAAAFFLPTVSLFGVSTGALRLTALLFTTIALAFCYLVAKTLFKSGKNGLIALLFFTATALPYSLSVTGGQTALLFCALALSAYCALRFFSYGVSSKNPVKSGLSVLFSGIFSALALAIDYRTIFPVCGILLLLSFGVKRQKRAHEYALSKISEEDTQERRKETASYRRKNKLVFGYAAISFLVATLVFLLVGTIIGYHALVRIYDDPKSPALGFLTLLFKSLPSLSQSGKFFSANINLVTTICGGVCYLFTLGYALGEIIRAKRTNESLKRTQKRVCRVAVFSTVAIVCSILQAIFTAELFFPENLLCAFSLSCAFPIALGAIENSGKSGKIVANALLVVVLVGGFLCPLFQLL